MNFILDKNIIHFNSGGCRPASHVELELFADIEQLQAENEVLNTIIFNLQQQLQIEGHSEKCACVQAASIDCSCGARKL